MAKKQEKREPILADLFIAHDATKGTSSIKSPIDQIAFIKGVQQRVRFAEKFVFDPGASERVGLVLRDIPELLIEQIQFARPPFERCWIEYEFDPIFDLLNPDKSNPIDQSRDKKIGMLIDHNRIIVVTLTHAHELAILPFAYNLNTEWALKDQLEFCGKLKISRLQIDLWLWGALGAKFLNEGKINYLRVLRDTNMAELLIDQELSFEHASRMIASTMGDFKNHMAILLMLNQPALTQYVKVPSTRGWIRHKPRPFMSYNTIHMALDAVPKIRKMYDSKEGPGNLRRRHRVRGHYCHNEAARKALIHHTCIHDWQPTDDEWTPIKSEVGDDVEHWFCANCSGKRWWREEHRRGHYSEGEIKHTYEVSRYEKAPD